jgi:ABC-type anion transport system duplicated permease subunit
MIACLFNDDYLTLFDIPEIISELLPKTDKNFNLIALGVFPMKFLIFEFSLLIFFTRLFQLKKNCVERFEGKI